MIFTLYNFIRIYIFSFLSDSTVTTEIRELVDNAINMDTVVVS